MTDKDYINRCIELALKAKGKTYPNPMVGCVIVHEGKIIGEGYHQKAGEPHAEINAIQSVENKELLKEATLYVSLEPCSHYGKTPPCALKIIETGFKKVVIGTLDHHEKVNGKGKDLILNAGIEVQENIQKEECTALNKRFFTYHQKKRPFILLKWAESADGFIDKDFKPYPIGNQLTQQFVHKIRSEEHAILVGTQTALTDNPSLTTRKILGRNPIRILIDFDLKVPTDFNIFNHEAETIILNSRIEKQIENLHFIKIHQDKSLQNILDALYEKNIQSVLVEGGRKTLQRFIDAGIWDEAIIIKNPDLFLNHGTQAPKFSSTPDTIEKFREQMVEFHKNPNHV